MKTQDIVSRARGKNLAKVFCLQNRRQVPTLLNMKIAYHIISNNYSKVNRIISFYSFHRQCHNAQPNCLTCSRKVCVLGERNRK
jgi:hypothetical protein